MPPTKIRLGIKVPYFGTDGEKLSGAIGRDMSIISYTTSRVIDQLLCWYCGRVIPTGLLQQIF